MELNFDKIIRIKKIRIEKSELSKEENKLSSPVITDKENVKRMHDIFKEILNEMACPPNPDSVYQRKKFVFIVLFMCSPDALAGSRMAPGLRDELAKAMGMKEPSTVSNYCSDLVFFYQNYSDFRENVNEIFSKMTIRLREEGLIE